jgi:glycosyltransferase involved in cell wall biosynthesis
MNAIFGKRRIMHLRTVVGRGGGPEKTLLHSHRYLDPEYAVRLLYIHPREDRDFDMPQRAAATGADLVTVEERFGADLGTLPRVLNEILRYQPHVLHAHDYKTDLLGVFCSKALRIPVVTTLHGNVTHSKRLSFYYKLDRWALRRMRKVIAVSSDTAELAAAARVPGDRIVLIHNGIDLEQYQRTLSREQARSRLGWETRPLVIGAVGRLMPEKGFDVLIRAIAQLRKNGWSVRLVICGEGAERTHLESLIRELGCVESVSLLGHRTDVSDVLQACDAFVLSSRREAMPNVVLEAMALGVPVVATRVAGVPEMLEHERTGLIIDIDNVNETAASIHCVTHDREMANRLSRAARDDCERRFCFRVRMQREQAVYDDLLGCVEASC